MCVTHILFANRETETPLGKTRSCQVVDLLNSICNRLLHHHDVYLCDSVYTYICIIFAVTMMGGGIQGWPVCNP
jgi:hypothetical protein